MKQKIAIFSILMMLLLSFSVSALKVDVLYKNSDSNKVELAGTYDTDTGGWPGVQVINSSTFSAVYINNSMLNGQETLGVSFAQPGNTLNVLFTNWGLGSDSRVNALGLNANTEESGEVTDVATGNADVTLQSSDYSVNGLGLTVQSPESNANMDKVNLENSASEVMTAELDTSADFSDALGQGYEEVNAIHISSANEFHILVNNVNAKEAWLFAHSEDMNEETPVPVEEINAGCTENDGGDKPKVPGSVKALGKLYQDHCSSPGLVEYFCQGSKVAKRVYECSCEVKENVGSYCTTEPVAEGKATVMPQGVGPAKAPRATARRTYPSWIKDLERAENLACPDTSRLRRSGSNAVGVNDCNKLKRAVTRLKASVEIKDSLTEIRDKICRPEDKDKYCNKLRNAITQLETPADSVQALKNFESKMCPDTSRLRRSASNSVKPSYCGILASATKRLSSPAAEHARDVLRGESSNNDNAPKDESSSSSGSSGKSKVKRGGLFSRLFSFTGRFFG
ncbi:hypothetical protein D6777_02845 [Candidatus Woesearchaeota archaeon]|nr:MAG: hypothetical protein D6777_02845 [Candidatus Woesearchaeota archaeon]